MEAVRELPRTGVLGHRLTPPKRLLAALSDERLADRVRQGDGTAFELLYDRHHLPLLGFCRNMLRSQEEAEDAAQQVFISAYRALTEKGDRPRRLKSWLYAIGRNRCISMMRSRKEEVRPLDDHLGATESAPFESSEQQADLRALLEDLRNLPEAQRTALVLTELGGLSHAEVAEVLECEPAKVKALVFQGRATLIQQREAREAPCREIREEIASLTGFRLRGRARRHAKSCPGCKGFAAQVRSQRQLLALALPVVPSFGLKQSVLAATVGGSGGGVGGGGLAAGAALKSGGAFGASGAGGVAGSGGAAAGTGVFAALTAKAGVTKAATVALAAGSVATGVTAGDRGLERARSPVPRASAGETGPQAAAERRPQASPTAAESGPDGMVVGGAAPSEADEVATREHATIPDAEGEASSAVGPSVDGSAPEDGAPVDNREAAGIRTGPAADDTGPAADDTGPAADNGSSHARGNSSPAPSPSEGYRSGPEVPSNQGTSAPPQHANSGGGEQGNIPVQQGGSGGVPVTTPAPSGHG